MVVFTADLIRPWICNLFDNQQIAILFPFRSLFMPQSSGSSSAAAATELFDIFCWDPL